MNEMQAPARPILLVDDEPAFLQSLSMTLKVEAGLNNLQLCSDSREVGALLAQNEYSLIVMDQMMPHLSGLDLLERFAAVYPDVPMIVLTGMDQIERAVQCVRAGAFDYYVKTGETGRLLSGIRRALRHNELQAECRRLKSSLLDNDLRRPEIFSEIVTCSPKMMSVFKYVEAIAGTQEPVLISGDSGVGKELVAKAIYQLSSPEAPLVAVNVAGLDDAMFSDTLFGHVKGAFTGAERVRSGMIEAAGAGVLFLDEIGDLSTESQVKLLRLLQEREYYPVGSDKPKRCHARIVVATLHDLDALRREDRFRTDLYYRLRSHHVRIPALKERPEDLPLLLEHFLSQAAADLDKKVPAAPPVLLDWMAQYSFPGNIRELRAMVYDAVSLHQSGRLSLTPFKQAMGLEGNEQELPAEGPSEVCFPEVLPTLKTVADLLVNEAMKRANGNQSVAARLLGISQPSLSVRLKKIRDIS